MWIVYKTTNTINDKIYIGQHKVRWNNLDERYIGSGTLLKKAIYEYGFYNFTRTILAECGSQEEAHSLEKEYISELKSTDPEIGYNISEGGINQGSSLRWIRENDPERWEEIVKKMQINGKNSPSLFKKGHKLSAESIEKMKSNLPKKRRPMSEETKQKIREANTGKVSPTKGLKMGPLSIEHKQKLREAKLGKKLTESHRLNISLSLREYRKGSGQA